MRDNQNNLTILPGRNDKQENPYSVTSLFNISGALAIIQNNPQLGQIVQNQMMIDSALDVQEPCKNGGNVLVDIGHLEPINQEFVRNILTNSTLDLLREILHNFDASPNIENTAFM